VFREHTRDASCQMELPITASEWKVERIAGTGDATYRDGRLQVTIPAPLNYLWVRLTK
jgi:hypothetical protein